MIEREVFKNLITDYAITALKIDTGPNDDLETHVINTIVDFYAMQIDEIEKTSIFNLEKNYSSTLEFSQLLQIAKDIFFLDVSLLSEDTATNRELIFLKIKDQMSLDNLSKTGLRTYYESILGYQNVRVKYDAQNKMLSVYGEMPDSYKSSTIQTTMTNGVITVEGMGANEEITSVDNITITDRGLSTILYSKEDIISKLTEALKDENVSAAIISELVSGALSGVVDITGNQITVKSAAQSVGIVADDEKYKYLLENGFGKDIQDFEMLSAVTINIIKMINDKIRSINTKIGLVEDAYGHVYSLTSEQYRSMMDETVPTSVISNINTLKASLVTANEKIGTYYTELKKAEDQTNKLINQVQSLPATDSEVTDFINNINKIKVALEELEV